MIGILYGTFDLFHIGHENIIKRSKAEVDYLIVGVTTPEFDSLRGKCDVVDSINTRIENVKNTGLVDEIICENYVGQKIDDILKYNVDVIFFGSDWEGKMDYLNEYCKVKYFPRTEHISSTELRKKIKTGIIIGGSSDIGLGIIDMLLNKNYKVISTYNSKTPTLYNDKLTWFNVDLSKTNEIYSFIDKIKQTNKNIDCIIFNAGTTIRKPLENTTDEDIYNILNVNFVSSFIILRELKHLLTDDAKIIFTGSQMGINPHSTSILYGVSKSMIHSFVKNLVKEFDNSNITVNCIVPGFVETKWQLEKPIQIKENIKNKTALHRFANIWEIVNGFKFILENPYVNGALIEINGGYNYK